MATADQVKINIRQFFDEAATRDHWDDYAKIGEFLSKGDSPMMLAALTELETAIRTKIAGNAAQYDPSEQGQDVLRACFRDLEQLEGFKTPARAPIYVGFVTHTPFMDALAQGMHWEDIGAGSSHGRYTHRVQWYAIKKAGILGNKFSGNVFKSLGERNKFYLPENMPRNNLPLEIKETVSGTALWDILCDRIILKDNCEPEGDLDFRAPEKMNAWIQSRGKAGLPLLSAILSELAALHPDKGSTNLADIYSMKVYGVKADQMESGFRDVFDQYMQEAKQGFKPAVLVFDGPENKATPLFSANMKKKCFISTGIIDALGLGDDCLELRLLRKFRDEVLLNSELGRAEVNYYYAIAPGIVECINLKPNRHRIYRQLFNDYLKPIVGALTQGDPTGAHLHYRRMVQCLQRRYGDINGSGLVKT